jgi:hypothetical protein
LRIWFIALFQIAADIRAKEKHESCGLPVKERFLLFVGGKNE